MKRIAITLSLLILLVGFAATAATAQPVRNGDDVVWARDVEGAAMTLDGMLGEAAWQQAETIPLVWNQPIVLPGSSQRIEGNPTLAEPLDGNNGMLYLLRDGNTLWMGLMVQDKSVGGGRGLNVGNWFFDGFIMAMTDRSRRDLINYEDANNFTTRPGEFIYGWWHPADTTDGGQTYDSGAAIASGGALPGIEPRFFGDYGVGFGDSKDAERSPERQAVLNWAHTIDGIANDDTHGDDVGYTYEVSIDLSLMGYDFSQAGGDKVPFSFALQDADYQWPLNQDDFFVSRVWFQSQWANNFNEGVAYILGASHVTISSDDPELVTEPEFFIPNAGSFGAPTVDGALDEDVWSESDTLFQLQYQAPLEVMDTNPGAVAPYYQQWWRPDINGDDGAATVVDPTLGRVKMFFEGNTLYIGLDTDDQAISGIGGEDGRDGIRFTIRDLNEFDAEQTLVGKQFDFYVDSTGTVAYGLDAVAVRDSLPDAITASVLLKGASTVADPTDVDEGYQIEIAIDLTQALGYPDGLGDGRIWLSVNFFDGDILESQTDSYATRTWISGERNQGASLYGFLTAASAVATEAAAEIPSTITLYGNYPNPFNPTTTLRYALPQAGDVTVRIFDMLGRRVAMLTPGPQAAGVRELHFEATGLASGLYVYQLQVKDQVSGAVQSSVVGRMILVK